MSSLDSRLSTSIRFEPIRCESRLANKFKATPDADSGKSGMGARGRGKMRGALTMGEEGSWCNGRQEMQM